MINPLHIATASDGQLLLTYIVTLVMVLSLAAILLSVGPDAPRRRRWAGQHKAATALLLAVLWVATLYGGSKGSTNLPPVDPPVPGADGWRTRLYWDAGQQRYLPPLIPLREVTP